MVDTNLITSTEILQGYRVVKYLGMAKGFDSRMGFVSSLNTKVWPGSSDAMVAMATKLGANAIIGVKFEFFEDSSGVAICISYGTAVLVEPITQ